MDTSIRWIPNVTEEIFVRAKTRGHQCIVDYGSIGIRTVKPMFDYFRDERCQYEPYTEILGGFHIFYMNK